VQSAQVCKRGVYVCDRVVRESVVGESACVCVCVKHLNRCKTSNSCFGFFSRTVLTSKQGAEETCKALPSEALCKHPRKHGLIIRVCLQGCDHLLFRVWFPFPFSIPSWQPARPRTGTTIHFISFLYCTVVAICQSGNDLALLKEMIQLQTHFI